jgi:hypothetical protein
MTPNDTTKPKDRRNAGRIILVLLLLLIGGCFFIRKGRAPRAKPLVEASGPTVTPAPVHVAAPPAADLRPTPTPINYEAYFIESVRRFQTGVPAEGDKDRLQYNRGERARGVSNALPGVRKLTGWIGTLHKIQPLPGGKAAMAIELPETTILLQTWGDESSDSGAGTLIDQKSDLYHSLAGLKVGMPVFFDGEFLEDKDDWCKEGSKSVTEGFMSPKYIVRFREVRSARK